MINALLILALTSSASESVGKQSAQRAERAETGARASPERDPLVRRYAVVIGVNRPAKPDQRPLSYADDDAVRFFDVFREISKDAALFALLDDATQKTHPDAVADAELPEEALILERLEQMFARMRSDAAQGHPTELYLVYSGHGYVDDRGEGNLGLLDGVFSRSELYDQVLARSPATVNHVIIDACDAYFFVQSRGDQADVEAMLSQRAREFLDRQSLARYPNTGAILSTASAAETHEWSEIEGGVFSHSVRSGLLGAADADGDGSISYEEIESFVLAASAGVKHAKASRAIFVQAPARDRSHPVIPLEAVRGARRLTLGGEVSGRLALLDQEGRRYLDLNKASGYQLALQLLPGRQYFLRFGESEYRVPGEGDVAFSDLSPEKPSIAVRGSGVGDAYSKGLFSLPYGPQVLMGFQLRSEQVELRLVEDEGTSGLVIAGISTGALAVVAGGVAIATYVLGGEKKAEYDRTTDLAVLTELDGEIRGYNTAGSVALASAVSLALTTGVLFLIDWLWEP